MKKLKLRDLSYFFIGSSFLTLGVRIIGISPFGFAFSDAIIIKISQILSIPMVLSSIILGIFTLIVEAIVSKKKMPQFSCLITSFVLGFFVDFWFFLIPGYKIEDLFLGLIVFLIGIFVLSIGVAIYLQPKYPPHPNDLLFVSISKRFKFSIFKSKILMDSMHAVVAILLLAPIGIGSIFNTLCLGYFINILYKFFEKKYNKIL